MEFGAHLQHNCEDPMRESLYGTLNVGDAECWTLCWDAWAGGNPQTLTIGDEMMMYRFG